MAKKFSELRQRMTPEAQEKSSQLALNLKAEMPLNELRQAHGLSQATIAQILDVRQPTIAKMEKSVDMYVSTLRNYIEAMGGALRITAEFPDGIVQIGNFTDIPHYVTGEIEAGIKVRTAKRRTANSIKRASKANERLVVTG